MIERYGIVEPKATVSNKQRRQEVLKKIANKKTVNPAVIAIDPCIWIRKERERPFYS